MPSDPVFSFGIGLYGIAIFAAVAVLLLKSKTWK